MQKIFEKRLFFETAAKFANRNHHDFTFTQFLKEFEVPASLVRDFRKQVHDRGIEITEDEMVQNMEYIRHRLKAEIARSIWGIDKFYRILLEKDNQFLSARQLFPLAGKIINHPHNVTVTN
jgi:CRISPR/Cas system CSM-associated protein Csm2 small subunit